MKIGARSEDDLLKSIFILKYRRSGRNWKHKIEMNSKKKPEEQVIQSFPHRCPYCNHLISYDQFDLKIGENELQCPSCKKIYIKVVGDSLEEKG